MCHENAYFPYSRDLVIFPVSRHNLYSKNLVVSPVSRHFPYSKVSRNKKTTKSLKVLKELGQFSCFLTLYFGNGWKITRSEGWNIGRLECWKIVRLEG